jgi:alpha-galactosidase
MKIKKNIILTLTFSLCFFSNGFAQFANWDGFLRINTETQKGGIVGIFRHGAIESTRIVTIDYLNPAKIYEVRRMDGKVITALSGEKLRKTGFEVTVSELYGGELYEINSK